MPESKNGDVSVIERYFAERQLAPLKGALTLYRRALASAMEWPGRSPSELQYDAYDFIPDAVSFTIWNRLRLVVADQAAVERERQYVEDLLTALDALLNEHYDSADVYKIAELGREPKQVVERYDSLLREIA